jgi:hypothetical protein
LRGEFNNDFTSELHHKRWKLKKWQAWLYFPGLLFMEL